MNAGQLSRHITFSCRLAAILIVAMLAVVFTVSAQKPAATTTLAPPYNPAFAPSPEFVDSVLMPFPVQQTVPQSYEQLMSDQFAADLSTPSNIQTVTEFDPETGMYVIRTKVGNFDVATPFMLSEKQYNNMQLRESMQKYYQQRNSEAFLGQEKNPFNPLDMHFAIGPLEKI